MIMEKEFILENLDSVIENNKFELEKLRHENFELKQELSSFQRYKIFTYL